MEHEIIYMNPAAVLNYEKWGGEKLIGRSLMECHNQASREKIQQVVDWFIADEDKLEKVLENPQVIKTPVVRNSCAIKNLPLLEKYRAEKYLEQ